MIPLVLPGAVETEIMLDVIDSITSSLTDEADEALPDGIFPSLTKITSRREKLADYLVFTDPADLPLLADPQYLDRYRAGLALAPVSPRWQSIISLPEQFKQMRREFLSLLESQYGVGNED